MRNSFVNKSAIDYLCKSLNHHEYHLTALNLKYCFLTFEFFIQLADALRFNKSLVKLDLSNNALKNCTAKYMLETLRINQSLTEINFHSNLLNDDFAYHLADLLCENPILHTVDISKNPIGVEGAKAILNSLLTQN